MILKDRDAIWEFSVELDELSRELRDLAASVPPPRTVGGLISDVDRGERRRLRAVLVLTKIRAMAAAMATRVAEAR